LLIFALFSWKIDQSLVQDVEGEGGWQTGGLCSDMIGA